MFLLRVATRATAKSATAKEAVAMAVAKQEKVPATSQAGPVLGRTTPATTSTTLATRRLVAHGRNRGTEMTGSHLGSQRLVPMLARV